MAQVIGYREDNIEFTEGPFVICNALGNGWRIEIEMKGYHCPVLPDASIYGLIERHGRSAGKFANKQDAEDLCDWLNRMVNNGHIVLDDNTWIAKRGEI